MASTASTSLTSSRRPANSGQNLLSDSGLFKGRAGLQPPVVGLPSGSCEGCQHEPQVSFRCTTYLCRSHCKVFCEKTVCCNGISGWVPDLFFLEDTPLPGFTESQAALSTPNPTPPLAKSGSSFVYGPESTGARGLPLVQSTPPFGACEGRGGVGAGAGDAEGVPAHGHLEVSDLLGLCISLWTLKTSWCYWCYGEEAGGRQHTARALPRHSRSLRFGACSKKRTNPRWNDSSASRTSFSKRPRQTSLGQLPCFVMFVFPWQF